MVHIAKKFIKVIDDDVTANDYAVDGEELEEVYLEVVAVFIVSFVVGGVHLQVGMFDSSKGS